MNDDELKREIEEALSVNPSPEFGARVRTRIAENSRTSAARIRWSVVGAALTTAAIVIVVVVSEPVKTVMPQPVLIAKVEPKKLENEVPSTPAPKSIKKTPKVTEPEILIDPREMAAFRKFVEGVQENRIDISQVIALQRKAAESLTIENIALMPLGKLEPIVIEPLGGSL